MPDQNKKTYKTEVYLLFPECIDVGREMSALYIKGYTFNFDECIPAGLKEIMDVVDFFGYERINYYYDSKNLNGLYYPNDVLEEYPFVDTMVRSTITQMSMEDWRAVFEKKNLKATWHGNILSDDTCTFAHSRSIINNEREEVHATIVSSGDAMELVDNSITITNNIGEEICIDVQTSILDMYKWLCVNRLPQRRYKYSKKHGENGNNNGWRLPDGTPAAVLECGAEHAQELLCKAIGDTSIDNNLWYYDEEFREILYCEYQNNNPQNEYHCYHMSPGEKGYNKVNVELLRHIQDGIPDKWDEK